MAGKENGGSIFYDVEMDIKGLLQGQEQINARLNSMDRSLANTNRSINTVEKSSKELGTSFTSLATAVKAYVTVQTAMKLMETAQQFQLLATRVEMVSKNSADGARNFKALMDISAQNGSDLKETVNLFTQMSATLRSVGATSGDVQRLVSTLQKIGTIGGSSQEEMNNALRQFMQSMASGRVQAEEFNSIIEQMPELGRQIAAGMGIPFSELRQQMLAGKLDIGSVLEAVYKQTDEVNTKFEDMPRTVAQASNALLNSFGNAIAQLDKTIGSSKYLAKLLDGAALSIDVVTGNASNSAILDQQLKQNAKDLASAESDLNNLKKTGLKIEGSLTQKSVQRLKAERQLLQLARQTNEDLNSAVSGQTAGNKTPEYIKNLSKNAATNSANSIIQAGQSQIEKLTVQREQLKANFDKQLLDKETYQKADAVLNQKIAEERKKGTKKAGAKSDPYAQGVSAVSNLERQLGTLALRYDENSREAAQFNAVQALGIHATDAQKARVSELAGELYDAQQRQRDLNAAINNDPIRKENRSYSDLAAQLKRQFEAQIIDQQTYNKQSEQLEQNHQIKLSQIKASQVLSPQREALGQVDPIIQEQNQYAQRLALIQEFENQKVITTQQASDARQRILDEENAKQMSAISTMLGAASQGFDGIAGVIEATGGRASGAYKTMFAASKAFAVAQAALNLQTALSQVMADPTAFTPAQKMANYASIAAAGGQLLSSIGSISYGGGREHGGPVSANSMYRVGEGGKPEIYQASNGSQYMIPGDNGRVISNRDIGSGGGGVGSVSVVNNFTINTTNGIDQATMNQIGKIAYSQSLRAIRDEQRPNGMLEKSR